VNTFMESLEAHLSVARSLNVLNDLVMKVGQEIIRSLKNDHTFLVFGNGGSAADAQHIAAELVGRFKKQRRGLPAMALTTDTSILTAVGNDFSYDMVFARQVEAFARPGACVMGISTSGNSVSIIEGIKKAKELGCFCIGLIGCNGGKLKDYVDAALIVPSNDTPRIQECHILLGHSICEMVEDAFA